MSYFQNMENQHQQQSSDVNLNADYTSAEQLLASVGEQTLGDPTVVNHGGSYRAAAYNTAQGGPTNDWNYGVEGLLDPLRRPDPNQIPPDVLSFLLKNGQFSELLNPNHSAQFGGNLCETGVGSNQGQNTYQAQQGTNWTQGNNCNSNQGQHWSTQNMSGSSSSSGPSVSQFPPNNMAPPQQGQQNRYQSNLSPLAAEFVPRQYSPQRQEADDVNLLTMAIAQLNQNSGYDPAVYPQQTPQMQYGVPQPPPARHFSPHGPAMRQHRQTFTSPRNPSAATPHRPRHARPQSDFTQNAEPDVIPYEFETNADRVLTFVVDTISYLTHDPANYNSSIKKVLRVLAESLTDSDTLEIMITLIIEQSVTNRNFFTTGARMCQTFNENRVKAGQLPAQKCVIIQAQNMFTSALNSMPAVSEDLRERHIGILMFLSELFVRFKVEGKPFFGFGVAICEMIVKFLVRENEDPPKHDNVKVVLNVLKLVGWELDQHVNPILIEYRENMMTALSEILKQETLPSNTKALIEKIFDLREKNWGRTEEEAAVVPSKETTPPSSVVYGGKEQENIYEEPSSSDEEGDIYLDEEAEKCYDQFLSENHPQQ